MIGREMEEGNGGGKWRREMEEGNGGGKWRREMEEGKEKGRLTLSQKVTLAVRIPSETVVRNDSAGHGGSGEDGNLGEVHVD